MGENSGLVPSLRFPEFQDEGEWENYKLSQLSERITEKVNGRKLTTVSITAGLGFVSQAEKFGRDISGAQYKNYIQLKKGQFSYNKGNSKTFPQGCIYQLNEFDEVAVPNAFISFKFFDGFVPEFFKGYFDSNFHGYQLLRFITSGARSDGLLNISPADFFSIRLPAPKKKEEQQKIADCLSSLDALIAAQAEIVDALKTHKKGLMQQLFPLEGETVPRLRFPEFRDAGEWDLVRFSTQVELISGLHLTPGKYSSTGDVPYFTGPSDYSNSLYLVKKWTERRGNVARYGDTLITVKGNGVGELFRLELDEIVMGRQLMAIRPSVMFGGFVFYFLETQRQRFIELASGNLIPGLSRGDILSLKVPVPKPEEQQEIADCLSSLDAMISAQAERFDALKTHKKWLMQQLFPSIEAAVS